MVHSHHVPIAILGAFSVAIAGILALVKGQGLPMRLRIVCISLMVTLSFLVTDASIGT